MAPPDQADHRKAIIAAGVALALVERKMLRGMKIAVGAAAVISQGHVESVRTETLIAAQTRVIYAGRALAKVKAAKSFAAQTGLVELKPHATAADLQRARKAAKSLTERLADDEAAQLERTAATEVPDAWNAEWRSNVEFHVAQGLHFTHEWNASSDACDKCYRLHGETVVDDDTFPEGQPPLHPHCRCRIDTTWEP